MTTKPTEPTFLRDPGSLITRCICPHDGTWMHVTGMGFWECDASLHQWRRHSQGVWKLMKTFTRAKRRATIERQRFA